MIMCQYSVDILDYPPFIIFNCASFTGMIVVFSLKIAQMQMWQLNNLEQATSNLKVISKSNYKKKWFLIS